VPFAEKQTTHRRSIGGGPRRVLLDRNRPAASAFIARAHRVPVLGNRLRGPGRGRVRSWCTA